MAARGKHERCIEKPNRGKTAKVRSKNRHRQQRDQARATLAKHKQRASQRQGLQNVLPIPDAFGYGFGCIDGDLVIQVSGNFCFNSFINRSTPLRLRWRSTLAVDTVREWRWLFIEAPDDIIIGGPQLDPCHIPQSHH